jgi:hypothetical protein
MVRSRLLTTSTVVQTVMYHSVAISYSTFGCHPVQNFSSYRLLSTNVNIHIYKSVILLTVLCDSEILSLTLREIAGVWVFENRVLRRIFGPNRDKVRDVRRKLYVEELHNLFCFEDNYCNDQLKEKRWSGHVAFVGVLRHEYKDLGGKPEGKRPLEGLCIVRKVLKLILKKYEIRFWIGFIRLKIGTSGGLL